MAKLTGKANRPAVMALMKQAFRKGQTASGFINEMRVKGLSYRRTDMLSDWRTMNEVTAKEGSMRYVRKDFYPAHRAMAHVEWEMSQEYMYKVKVHSRLKPGEPMVERFVSIMSDNPMTPREVETQVTLRWGEWEKYEGESLNDLQVWSAYRKVSE